MLIEILQQTSIAGTAVRPGDVVECNEHDARHLVGAKKARLAGSQSLKPQSLEQQFGIESNDEPTVEERKPTVRRKKPKTATPTPEE